MAWGLELDDLQDPFQPKTFGFYDFIIFNLTPQSINRQWFWGADSFQVFQDFLRLDIY